MLRRHQYSNLLKKISTTVSDEKTDSRRNSFSETEALVRNGHILRKQTTITVVEDATQDNDLGWKPQGLTVPEERRESTGEKPEAVKPFKSGRLMMEGRRVRLVNLSMGFAVLGFALAILNGELFPGGPPTGQDKVDFTKIT